MTPFTPKSNGAPYFICALSAHIRVHDTGVGGAISFLVLATAALVTNLAYHNHWW